MQHRISAGAFVEDAGRLRLARQRKPAAHDFWVAPGGGVKGAETLAEAAVREVHEETGLQIAVDRLVYVEAFFNPHTRFCKFWFLGRPVGGALTTDHPEARAEHIVEAGWHTPAQMGGCSSPTCCTAGSGTTGRPGFPASCTSVNAR